jgi:niacin transporter
MKTGGLLAYFLLGGLVMLNTKKTVYTSLLIAVGVVLPVTLHMVPNAGSVLLPMHIPVLICGIACGLPYGPLCGLLTPLISSLLTGMPPAAYLPAMLCELAAYGLVSALLARYARTKNIYANVYIALLGGMLAGRMVFGALNALIFRVGEYSMQVWLTSAFVKALPGIAIQLVLIPAVVIALQKSKLVESTVNP